MEMRKCPRGHYYDASIHSDCPYCAKASVGGADDVGKTVGFTTPAAQGFSFDDDEDSKTMPLFEAAKNNDDDNRTVALIQKTMGIDPVVGWLVATDGSEKGRDYRIHSDNNTIGRSDRMDICIRGDETISRENQAIITYDGMGKQFFLSPGDGRSIVRVNDKAIFSTTELAAYDKIILGNTELLFIPLCGDKFVW